MGGCSEEYRTPLVALTDQCLNEGICVTSNGYTCDVEGGIMRNAQTWLGIVGMMIMAIMLAYKRNSGIIVGIMFVTFISWFRNTAVTIFPDDAAGDAVSC